MQALIELVLSGLILELLETGAKHDWVKGLVKVLALLWRDLVDLWMID